MDRLITLLCTMVLAGAMVWGWDRHAPVHYVLPWWTGHMHVGLPDSLATRAARADAEVAQWKAAYVREASALSAAEAGQKAVIAAGQAKLAEAAPLPLEARNSVAEAVSKRQAITDADKGSDPVCTRADAVDKAFLESLQ